jgi:hypothetical protein
MYVHIVQVDDQEVLGYDGLADALEKNNFDLDFCRNAALGGDASWESVRSASGMRNWDSTTLRRHCKEDAEALLAPPEVEEEVVMDAGNALHPPMLQMLYDLNIGWNQVCTQYHIAPPCISFCSPPCIFPR